MNFMNLLLEEAVEPNNFPQYLYWVIPVAGIALVLIGLIIFISIIVKKRKKTDAEKTIDDRELVATNSAAMDALVVLAQDNDEMIGELKELQEKLKYLIPSDEPKIYDADKKIKHLIGDMRIALTKSDGEESKKTESILLDLKLAVADRNTKL